MLWLPLLLLRLGIHASNPKSLALISLFLLHYFHCTFLYQLHLCRVAAVLRTTADFSTTVALMAFVFNLLNSYLQRRVVLVAIIPQWGGFLHRDGGERVVGLGSGLTEGGGRCGVQGAARGVVRDGELPQLPWGVCRVVGLGLDDMDLGRAGLLPCRMCYLGSSSSCES
ncbi:hypothetical protein TorRG33x02_275790 [Trema orientale]|uniref:Folate-biopterin transporter n=1 Tax=Trema orientale TaxID=63057 RepID=A0A2P5CRQ4_TREOI|nr:hypothetical protein TorRG33x02_275790 [Trema orientale]